LRLSRVALVVTTVIPLAVLAAKPSIIRFSPPTPDNYGVEKFWNLTLDNPDGSTYDTVWLEGYIFEATAGEVFRAITYEFELPPGQMRIQYADIKRIGLKNIEYAEGYAEFAGRYGGLPPGAYSFEIRLMPDFDTVQPDPIVVRPMGPPRLILPRDGDTIRVKYPRFSWTPPGPPPSGPVAYTLQVFEVLPEQTKEEAAAANPPWFTTPVWMPKRPVNMLARLGRHGASET